MYRPNNMCCEVEKPTNPAFLRRKLKERIKNMSMDEWAKREVEIACKKEAPNRKSGEFDYGCACYESALKAYLSLCEDQHSGMSFGFTRSILLRLLYARPLTAIEDKEDEWNLVFEAEDGKKEYQCKRMSSLFKDVEPDGTVKFHANNYYCTDEYNGTTYFGGGAHKILEQYIEPITMPYYPPTKDYEIHTKEYLTDSKNGDFDTKVYMYIICPDGRRIEVNKAYAETENGWQEISEEELKKRIEMHEKRVNAREALNRLRV